MARRDANQLTASEVLNVQAINGGTYFVENEVPSGAIDDSNTNFTLANTPSPAASLELVLNGVQQKAGGFDFTLSGAAISFVVAPPSGSVLLASYRRAV